MFKNKEEIRKHISIILFSHTYKKKTHMMEKGVTVLSSRANKKKVEDRRVSVTFVFLKMCQYVKIPQFQNK